MTALRIAIATCRELPEPDVDEELLSSALRARGAEPVLVAWDAKEPLAESESYDLCVIRSTWNYWEDPPRFACRLRTMSEKCPLWNSLEHSLWNLDKRYLAELEEEGSRSSRRAGFPEEWTTTAGVSSKSPVGPTS